MRGKKFLILGLFLFLTVVVSASFTNGNYDLSNIYGENSELSAWVEMGFIDVPIDSLFVDSMGNSVPLKDVLETSMNSNFDYECNIENCLSNYSLENLVDEKFFMELEESKIFGVKLSGKIKKINSIKFNITSDGNASCESQLKIDLLDDESFEILNNKASSETCSNRDYGCFTPSETIDVKITSVPFCQKIEFTEAPGYQIGAWIKESKAGTDSLYAAVYDLEGKKINECEIPKSTLSANGGNSYCNINSSFKEPQENYVCISTKGNESSSNRGDFFTRGYTEGDVCGFMGLPPSEAVGSYEIYVQNKKFDSIGTLQIFDNSSEEKMSKLFEEYIIDKYKSLDCIKGCIVPLRLDSFSEQNISISGIEINYDTALGNVINNFDVYELDKTASKIDAKSQKLYFDSAGFKLIGSGKKDYWLKFLGKQLFKEKIEIKSFSITITPTKTAIEYPTTFKIATSPVTSIINSQWDFGDNSTGNSLRGEITHTYTKKGKYLAKVVATDNGSIKFTKEFNVEVGAPAEIIDKAVKELDSNIVNLKTQISTYEFFIKDSLLDVLNLTAIEKRVGEIKKELELENTEAEEIAIMKELVAFGLPERITTLSTNKMPYSFNEDNVNLNALDEFLGEAHDSLKDDFYIKSINTWAQANIDVKISTQSFYFDKYGENELALKVFDLTFTNRAPVTSENFFMENIGDVKFKKNITEKERYYYADLSTTKQIVFSTTEDIGYNEIPMFIAPDYSEFVYIDVIDGDELSDGLGLWFWIALIVVIIGGFFGYYYLEKWYDQKYENKLFPNRNNLYNLIHYIQVEKDKGVPDSDIRSNLRKLWSVEQINYVMKKYTGENTGMMRLFSKKKKIPYYPPQNDFNTQKFNK